MCNNNDHPDVSLPDYVKEALNGIFKAKGMNEVSFKISPGSAKGDNYLGQISRVTIQESKTLSLIVKTPPYQSEDMSLNKVYNKEMSAYLKVLPVLFDCQVPSVPEIFRFQFAEYHAGSAEVNNEFIILEDISIDGFKMYDRKKSLDYQHLKLIIENLARFHATSFVLKRKNEEQFNELLTIITHEIDYSGISDSVVEKSVDNLVATIVDDECKEKYKQFLKNIKQRSENYLKPEIAAPYNVITHGDFWIGNLMFKYEGSSVVDVRFLDWQTLRSASPVTDLAYLIFTCTDEQIRDDHYVNVLNLYHETLQFNVEKMGFNIDEIYPKNVFENHVKILMPYGLLTASVTLPMILSDDSENDSGGDYGEEDDYSSWFLVDYSQLFVERINGIVRHHVKFQYI